MEAKDHSDVVPLDDVTLARLERLERATGTPKAELVAGIVRDVLEDDENHHAGHTRH